ncbi:MAG: UDP-N-acetylglucosamine 2-epimerase (non-hydrolyzing) [Gemmatimonadetes bacterium]|nr:UDP-N-acetylglucosamine 2-epimerase (non-hydrolyzing) [Gemmatimonadota bacterium]MBT5327134.1 UDP-N-acetylglucosamine 2-epimerase (non-hydrolyzing) [Gemmatimonadota bacterium]MBT5451944.1 UDP-N-acetylglucosamine 2-epimerase (non-hydrolyzing) [Gemmatimonadota bacterium]MBT5800302.1 UDP-N-acetylglucosamine 2-epimerase (non-hydrolyzing) [Gemmatimonadota bacterium]MBT6619811.1 UDP-N-acetylglucosamine 2-epimerase (non-hydrolyzing) [Gemmatimonadota bacterium]
MKIAVVAGTRPNFMKVAPILAELHRHPEEFTPLFVHTGQHYDYQLSEVFAKALELPAPDAHLDVVRDNVAQQMADIIAKFDRFLEERQPDLVMVVGDVTSTAACALAAAQRFTPVAHVEAGLRSRDRTMPEELNRLVADTLSDLLFTYSADADQNLLDENIPTACIHRVGNVMIDTLLNFLPQAEASPILDELQLEAQGFALVTMHRASNVDKPDTLAGLLDALDAIQQQLPVVFPVHPRTRNRIEEFGFAERFDAMPGLRRIEPLGYFEIIRLQQTARLAITDSAGLAEETTALGVPCLTMRENTERPITITEGSNQLVGCDPERIIAAVGAILKQDRKTDYPVPKLWDGQSAQRLVAVLQQGIARR